MPTNPPDHLRFRQKKNEVKTKPILYLPTDCRHVDHASLSHLILAKPATAGILFFFR